MQKNNTWQHPRIAVIVPTIREDCWEQFIMAWQELFAKHQVQVLKVEDNPDLKKVRTLQIDFFYNNDVVWASIAAIVKDPIYEEDPIYCDLFYNANDGIRNLGFAYAAKYIKPDVYITLDDDVIPHNGNDPIQEHLDVLGTYGPINWTSTASEPMRGFPYNVRHEAKVVVSHGVWEGVKDYDAPTQLVNGTGDRPVKFAKGIIPKGTFFPFCIMNVAFLPEALPWMYQAPMGKKVEAELGIKIDRFADIWCGLVMKQAMDKLGHAVCTGNSTIKHLRASNVFANLKKEALGIEWNEHAWKIKVVGEDLQVTPQYYGDLPEGMGSYWNLFCDRLKLWQQFLKAL